MSVLSNDFAAAVNVKRAENLSIMHVVFSLKFAGSERYCADLANAQADGGHVVHVVGSGRAMIRKHLNADVVYHSLSHPCFKSRQLQRVVDESLPDVMHGHLSGACKAIGNLKSNAAKIATLHVGYKVNQHATMDGLICVNSEQELRLKYGIVPVRFVQNWLTEDVFSDQMDLRKCLGIGPETKIIGSSGRLYYSKGFDVLLSAFKQVADDNVVLVVVGDGKERRSLEKIARGDKRIHFLGHFENIRGFLRNLDLFISPSREESAGLSIIEAMSEELPIIATRTLGPSEYLAEQPVTLLEPGSVTSLAEAIRLWLDMLSAIACKMSYDLSEFDRQANVDEIIDFYREIISLKHVSLHPSFGVA